MASVITSRVFVMLLILSRNRVEQWRYQRGGKILTLMAFAALITVIQVRLI
jgi:hypothetical protein